MLDAVIKNNVHYFFSRKILAACIVLYSSLSVATAAPRLLTQSIDSKVFCSKNNVNFYKHWNVKQYVIQAT